MATKQKSPARIRTDIHAPSRIIPADYTFVAFSTQELRYLYDANFMTVVGSEFTALRLHMQATGGAYSDHEHGGSCHICGAHAIYLCVFYHEASNTYIKTGQDCAAKMGMADERRFRRLKDAIEAAQLSRAGWKKAEGVLALRNLGEVWSIFTELKKPDRQTVEAGLRAAGLDGDPLALAALRDLYEETGDIGVVLDRTQFEERTLVDIVEKLARYGSLSDKQYGFLGKLVNDIRRRPERAVNKVQAEQKRAEEAAKLPPIPEGRWTGLVEVVKVDVKNYGGGGPWSYQPAEVRHVMTVRSVTGGWAIWGTIPSALVGTVKAGDRLDLTATLEKSDRPGFGFFKRPAAQIVVG